MPEVGAVVLRARYLRGAREGLAPVSQVFGTAGRFRMILTDIPWPVIVDEIDYQVGAVSAGQVRLGIYQEGATVDSPAGAALVVESAIQAQGAANNMQRVPIADTLLIPGKYFVGIEGDNVLGTFVTESPNCPWLGPSYDIEGGFGPCTNPCPAVFGSNTPPFMVLRVKQNLPAGSLHS